MNIALVEKYWKPLAMILLAAFCYGGHTARALILRIPTGKGTDLADSTDALHRDVSERAEEQRR